MKRPVILRPDVPDDLRGIMVYLEQSSLPVADRFIEAAFNAFDDLAEWPGKGSPKQFRYRLLRGIRSWAVPGFPNHLIYYQTADDAIIILAVIHGARNVEAVLRERVRP
jgi:toxin ParE1/3/4